MEFCSRYGYNYGFNGSESEEYSDEDEKTRSKVTRKIRKADPNIIAIRFDQLVAPNERFAGEPKICKKCSAAMSFLSEKNVSKIGEQIIWSCEFCDEKNDMSKEIDDFDEIPKKEDVTFMLEVPQVDNNNKLSDAVQQNVDDSYLTFCMDVSGSMDSRIVTKNCDQKVFTRLMGVKGACMDTLKKLNNEEPSKCVALVTFSSVVKYFGDCRKVVNNRPLLIIDDSDETDETDAKNLHNQERIITFANNLDADLKSIKDSYQALDLRLRSLRTEGSTALGPALLFSITFASKKPGSSIVLCTDGCANVGLGSMESRREQEKDPEKFYDYLAEYAKEKGVTVNVISMEGTDCKLALLGRVADKSNGTLNIVNPMDLGEEFRTILENRIVATNVTAKLIVNHKYLYIRDDKIESEESKAIETNDEHAKKKIELKKQSIVSRKIGNANIDTEITFEYGIRKIENEVKENLTELPFQLQISYNSQDGSKALRVYTKLLKFTTNRQEAERNIVEKNIFFAHNAQMMSNQVLASNVVSSKYRSHASKSLMNRNTIAAPFLFEKFSNRIDNYSKSKKSAEMDDEDAQVVYLNSKMTRLKLTKNT